MYFFLPPAGFAVSEPADLLSLGVLVATGLLVSWLSERVRLAEMAQRTMAEMATARAERLDAHAMQGKGVIRVAVNTVDAACQIARRTDFRQVPTPGLRRAPQLATGPRRGDHHSQARNG